MDLSLNEEQQLLQDSARDFLRQECPTTHVRTMEDDATGYSPELWRQIAALGRKAPAPDTSLAAPTA